MNLETLNLFDVILGGTVLISALIGIARGLVREILSLTAWLVALWAAFSFAEMVSEQFVKQVINDEHIAYIAAFGAVFLVTLFLIGLLNLFVSSLFKATGLGGFDRMLGMLFGLARGAVIAAVIVFFARLYPGIEGLASWQQSKLVPGFANLANWGLSRIPDNVRAYADSWLNPETVGILLPQEPGAPGGLELSSLQEAQDDNAQAARPQVSAEQARRQAEQSNTLSDVPQQQEAGLRLESLQDPAYEGEIEESAEQPGSEPIIRLESMEPQP